MQKALAAGPDVATQGRLLAFVRERRCDVARCTFLAVDEVDAMVDLGFHDQVACLARRLRPSRQTFCFSALVHRPRSTPSRAPRSTRSTSASASRRRKSCAATTTSTVRSSGFLLTKTDSRRSSQRSRRSSRPSPSNAILLRRRRSWPSWRARRPSKRSCAPWASATRRCAASLYTATSTPPTGPGPSGPSRAPPTPAHCSSPTSRAAASLEPPRRRRQPRGTRHS
mmetsp:Transcript_19135/g.61575  ORF Transcript_19135/g.61575 Transcript_19135/m.61575 type:complete len:226 (-) Transcript_19135:316-993(-)